MYLYLTGYGPNNKLRSQRFAISDQHDLSVQLMPDIMQWDSAALILVPKKDVIDYLNESEEIEGALKKLNEQTVQYSSGKLKDEVQDLYKKRNELRQEYEHKFVQVASLNLSKIAPNQKIQIPEYTPHKPFVPQVSAQQTAPAATSSKMIARGGEKILTLRIPEQEIKIGVNFSN